MSLQRESTVYTHFNCVTSGVIKSLVEKISDIYDREWKGNGKKWKEMGRKGREGREGERKGRETGKGLAGATAPKLGSLNSSLH